MIHKKNLDVLLVNPSVVVILDDRKDVWDTQNQENVIVMQKYHFFTSSVQDFGLSGGEILSELRIDEFYLGGRAYLHIVFQILRLIHNRFFYGIESEGTTPMDKDVRVVLKGMMKEVLKDCKIVFNSVSS
ncbi:hypothetical protein ACLB2K_024680 [Fragaria x ananassa]